MSSPLPWLQEPSTGSFNWLVFRVQFQFGIKQIYCIIGSGDTTAETGSKSEAEVTAKVTDEVKAMNEMNKALFNPR